MRLHEPKKVKFIGDEGAHAPSIEESISRMIGSNNTLKAQFRS